jgi:hypothetical protein
MSSAVSKTADTTITVDLGPGSPSSHFRQSLQLQFNFSPISLEDRMLWNIWPTI